MYYAAAILSQREDLDANTARTDDELKIKVEQRLSGVVTCGMLPNCVRMVCDLLTCLGRHSAKTEPLLEITDG